MTAWFRWLVVAVTVEAAACEHHAKHEAPGDASPDAPRDAYPMIMTPPFPATITVGASNGMVAESFAFDASGSAAAPLGAIVFTNDVGTLGVHGATPAAFVYATASEPPYTLYDGFAVGSASWDAFYIYCNQNLADVYDEGISGAPLFFASASGSCSAPTTAIAAQVSLPALSIPAPAPVGGYAVDGAAIQVSGNGTGAIVLAGQPLPLIVFDDVDCTTCGGTGWYELHSVIWDGAHARVVFVIIYLRVGMTSSVELAYARSLPDLADPIGVVELPATWSATSGRVEIMQTRGVPPPSLEAAQPF